MNTKVAMCDQNRKVAATAREDRSGLSWVERVGSAVVLFAPSGLAMFATCGGGDLPVGALDSDIARVREARTESMTRWRRRMVA